MKLRDGFAVSRGSGLESFIERHGVCARRVFLAAECAEAARSYADVRRIDVPVDVEVSLVAMHALANRLASQPTARISSGAIERESFVRTQPLACHDFIVNRMQAGIVGLKRMVVVRHGHRFNDIPAPRQKSQRGASMSGNHTIADLVILRLRDDPPFDQIVTIGERTVGDNAVGFAIG